MLDSALSRLGWTYHERFKPDAGGPWPASGWASPELQKVFDVRGSKRQIALEILAIVEGNEKY